MNFKITRQLSLICAPIFFALALSGCGGGSDSVPESPSSTVTRGKIGTFDFTFSTSKLTFKPGEGVPLTLTITNTGPERIVATGGAHGAGEGNRMNAVVEKRGVSIFRKFGAGFGDYSENNWNANETRTYSFTWLQKNEDGDRVTPGTYQITPFVPHAVNVGVTNPETKVAPPLEITIESSN